MAKLNQKQLIELARKIVAESPDGIRNRDLRAKIHEQSPETNMDSIRFAVFRMYQKYPNEIMKPSRGVFKPVAGPGETAMPPVPTEQTELAGLKEADFYEPFARWLRDEFDEVTEAEPLGGSGLKAKFGTPDVIGVYKPDEDDLIQFPAEIVSAEVKIDPQASVVAFGQAIAYQLFSHKTYIAMPKSIGADDRSRLESLCMLFGVGLVFFELNKDEPGWDISVRARRSSPDMFYVNEFAKRLKHNNGEIFKKLFTLAKVVGA